MSLPIRLPMHELCVWEPHCNSRCEAGDIAAIESCGSRKIVSLGLWALGSSLQGSCARALGDGPAQGLFTFYATIHATMHATIHGPTLGRQGSRPSRKALELDPGQEPLCKTFARGPCAGPSPRALVQDPSQGPMCRTHACKPGAHVQDPCRARVYRTQAVAATAAATSN